MAYATIETLLKGIKTDFFMKMQGNPVNSLASLIFNTTSENDSEIYVFSDLSGGLKEWLDKINWDDYKIFEYAIRNKNWARGLQILRTTVSDARKQLGGIEQDIGRLANEWVSHPSELVQSLMVANGLAFDGTAFFATDRPNFKGVDAIDNLKTGGGVTLTLIKADLITARTAVLGYKDKSGNPLNEGAILNAVVPVHLEGQFLKLKNNQQTATGGGGAMEDNELQGTFNIVRNSKQAVTDNDWYLANGNAALKPFIYQLREKPTWDFINVKDDLYLKFFTTGRASAGYGNPTAICKVNNV